MRVLMAVLMVMVLGACGSASENGSPHRSTTATTTTAPVTTLTTTTQRPSRPSTTSTTTETVPTSTTRLPIPRALLGQDFERIPTSDRVVALTFDAGANDEGVASILDTLRREHVPATFFLTGTFADRFPESAQAMAAHRIGNHSMTHPHFRQLPEEQIAYELSASAARIRSVTGADPAPWFRFPFGDRDEYTIEIVNIAGYVPVRWTVDTLGWQGTRGGQTSSSVLQRVINTLVSGQIVLMHVGSNPEDGSTLDANALPEMIRELRERGYSFVTLDALLT
jgi:peptidoglycan/xylan/chitin deacetylase (PgdA/CDA1 family)